MGRVNYNYDQRYLLTLTGRIDGSSRFGAENQYGFFPSVALAWNIANESFFRPSFTLNDIRLRLSWVKARQTGIDPYRTQGLVSRTAYNFGTTPAFGFKPNQIRNDDLRWETITSLNLGMQLEMFDSRLMFMVVRLGMSGLTSPCLMMSARFGQLAMKCTRKSFGRFSTRITRCLTKVATTLTSTISQPMMRCRR